jgi:hypothetical protein
MPNNDNWFLNKLTKGVIRADELVFGRPRDVLRNLVIIGGLGVELVVMLTCSG